MTRPFGQLQAFHGYGRLGDSASSARTEGEDNEVEKTWGRAARACRELGSEVPTPRGLATAALAVVSGSREVSRRIARTCIVIVTAVAITGCGGGSSLVTVPIKAAPAPVTRLDGRQRFIALVNAVCTTTRQGLPRALRPPYSSAQLQSYAAAAMPPAQRTWVSLGRVPAPGAMRAQVTNLAHLYGQLVGLYGAVANRAIGGAAVQSVRSIRQQEVLVTMAARSAGVPACALTEGR